MKKIVTFYCLACFISWLCWLPLYLPYFGIHYLNPIPFNHAIGALGPLLASIIIIATSSGKAGIKSLLYAMIKTNSVISFIIVLLGPLVLLFISLLVNSFITGESIRFSSISKTPEFPEFNFLTWFFYNLVFFGFGEETGWKGFMLPELQKKFSALTSGIIFTFFWAAWHIPLFLYRPGYMSMDLAGITGWVFSLLTGSILLTWLFNSTKGSILVCAIFHATIDMAFVSDVANKQVNSYLGILITVWGIITIIVLGTKNLSRNEKVTYLKQ